MPEHPKTKPTSKVREPKARKLGLKIEPLRMPHEDLIRQESVVIHDPQTSGYPQQNVDNMITTGLNNVDNMITTPSTRGYPQKKNPQTGGYPQIDRHRRTDEIFRGLRYSSLIDSKIRHFCAEHRLSFREFFERVVIHHFEVVDKNLSTAWPELVDNKSHHDDMMIFLTHDDIIMAYQNFTNLQWDRRDDRAGQKFNTVDIRLVEIAMVTTIERKLRGNTAKAPVKSFNYFVQEINLLIEQKRNNELPSALEEYHKYVLSTWEKRIRPLRDEKWAK